MSDRIIKPGTTSIETTTLGIGGTNLFRLPSASERVKVLCATYHTGVHRFDVASIYGPRLADSKIGGCARAGVIMGTNSGLNAS
jgi:aryl-alcohol dehydrogenase-like predicted oxidoreductase